MRGMASAGFGAAKGMGAAAVSVKGLGAAFKAALGPLGLAITAIGAVTAGVRGFVEADKARAAVRTLGVDAEALEGQLVGVVANTKGLASSNELLAASYDVASAGFSKAADISKILVSGDGGDELFGGYTFRYDKFLSTTSPNSTPLEKVKAYLQCHIRDHVPDQEHIFGFKSNFSWDSIYRLLLPFFDNSLSPIEQVFLADYNGKFLYNFDPVNSIIAKNFGVEMLAPLLSDDLISYAPHINNKYKYDERNKIGKLLLRKLLAKYKADSLISKEKLGFNVNTINLWKSYGYELCKHFLDNPRIVRDHWINKDWIIKHIDNQELDIRYVNKFLGILSFEIWYRLFVTKEMKSHEKL